MERMDEAKKVNTKRDVNIKNGEKKRNTGFSYKSIDLRQFDFWLFMSVIVLLSMGLITIFSASAPISASKFNGDVYYIFRNQLKHALIGILIMVFISFLPYKFWQKMAIPVLLVSIGLLIVVILPGVSVLTKDTSRWLYLGPINFQPSEVAKFGLICFLAASLSVNRDRVNKFVSGLLPYLGLVLIFVTLIMLEPHLSCSIIIILVASIMLLVAGAKLWHFIVLSGPVVAAGAFCIFFIPRFAYMKVRLFSFLDPWQDPTKDGWQIIQSLYAIGSGGLFGKGLGKSMQKFLYIPEPQNDFIFPILAEELGFVGVFTVLILFMILMWRGIKIAIMADDTFGSLFAVGLTSLIAVQSLFNIAVVTASVPVTGVSLPFFSYGGTSLILFLAEIGILLNISKSTHVDSVLSPVEIRTAKNTMEKALRAR
jgi:cell division protein FtsW